MPEHRDRRKRRRSKSSVTEVQRTLWAALTELRHELDRLTAGDKDVDTEMLCRVAHSISQLSSTYLRTAEGADFEERLKALERAGHQPREGVLRAA